ncbi:MAG: hypothetical protein IJW40_08025, partial [Clostridia bacterium]|nr:hypothetical protein [Clostridia bacterium]
AGETFLKKSFPRTPFKKLLVFYEGSSVRKFLMQLEFFTTCEASKARPLPSRENLNGVKNINNAKCR